MGAPSRRVYRTRIAPSAVADFLQRELRDSGRAKTLPDTTLDEQLAVDGLQFTTAPRRAQKVCTLLAWRRESYLCLLGLGAGKSKVVLDVFRNRRLRGQAQRALVVVPCSVNLRSWMVEARKHAPDVTAVAVDGQGEEERWGQLLAGDLAVVTYQGLCQLLSQTVRDEKRGRNRWVLDYGRAEELSYHVGLLALDESTLVGSHDSLYFRVARKLSGAVRYRLLLTGTPFGKNPESLWTQCYLADGGHALGETLGLFRAAFCLEHQTHFATEYRFDARKKDQLARRLRHCAVRISEEECQDLPPASGGLAGQDFLLLESTVSTEAWRYVELLNGEIVEARGDRERTALAYTKLRMLSSGYIGIQDEDGERVQIRFKDNPKLDNLVLFLRYEVHERVIVAYYFKSTGALLAERLTAEKVRFAHVYGGMPKGAAETAFASFEAKDGPQVLLGSTAIAYGVNLQHCRVMLVFESPDDPVLRRQLEGRIRREGGVPGQRLYYDFVVRGLLDERILASIRKGSTLLSELVDLGRARAG